MLALTKFHLANILADQFELRIPYTDAGYANALPDGIVSDPLQCLAAAFVFSLVEALVNLWWLVEQSRRSLEPTLRSSLNPEVGDKICLSWMIILNFHIIMRISVFFNTYGTSVLIHDGNRSIRWNHAQTTSAKAPASASSWVTSETQAPTS